MRPTKKQLALAHSIFGNPNIDKYRIVRFYLSGRKKRVIARGIFLSEAQRHCSDPESSSDTCTKAAGKKITALHGPWFDGYEKE